MSVIVDSKFCCSFKFNKKQTGQRIIQIQYQYHIQREKKKYQNEIFQFGRLTGLKGANLKFSRKKLNSDFLSSKNPENLLKILQQEEDLIDATNVGYAVKSLSQFPRSPNYTDFWPLQTHQYLEAFEILIVQIIKKCQNMNSFTTAMCMMGLGIACEDMQIQKNVPYFQVSYEKLVDRFRSQVWKCTESQLASAVWSLGSVKYYDEDLMSQIERRILTNRSCNFDVDDIGNVLFVISEFGYQNYQVPLILIQQMLNKYKGGTTSQPQLVEAVRMLATWDYNLKDAQLVIDVLQEKTRIIQGKRDFSAAPEMWKLRWAQQKYNSQNLQLILDLDLFSISTKQLQIHQQFQLQRQSILTDKIFKTLQQEFPNIIYKGICEYSFVIIDIIICQRKMIGVRIYDDFCVCCNDKKKLLGSVIAENQMLEKVGWKIVEIFGCVWDSGVGAQQQIQDQIQQLLDT